MISLPGCEEPIPISQAVLRWSKGQEFGIGFVALNQGPVAQLPEFFSSLTMSRRLMSLLPKRY